MTGLFRILFFIFLGYLLVKTFKFLMSVFKVVSRKKEDDRVYDTAAHKSKIDKKDVIDAQF